MQFIKIVDNSRSWRVFSLCSNSSPFFLSFSVSIFVSKNRNEAAAACSQRSSPPWASASQAGPASAPRNQPAQPARQPAQPARQPARSRPPANPANTARQPSQCSQPSPASAPASPLAPSSFLTGSPRYPAARTPTWHSRPH